MATQLRQDEAGTRDIRRIIRKELKQALARLERKWPVPDSTIHDVRRRLKKSRAALRLVRKALGDRAFRGENRMLRDAAKPLSEIRDARVLVDAFDDLMKAALPQDRLGSKRVRIFLLANQEKMRVRALGRKSDVELIIRRLRRARKRMDDWSPPRRGWAVLGWGVRRVYRLGRKAFADARRDPTTGNLHEWRKQAKYLWYQLQILEPIWASVMKRLGDQVHKLSDLLGDDHDLSVLRRMVNRTPAPRRRGSITRLGQLIDRKRVRLQVEAMALGDRVYEEKSGTFAQRLEGYWRAWRLDERSGRKLKPHSPAGRASRRLPAVGSARAITTNGATGPRSGERT